MCYILVGCMLLMVYPAVSKTIHPFERSTANASVPRHLLQQRHVGSFQYENIPCFDDLLDNERLNGLTDILIIASGHQIANRFIGKLAHNFVVEIWNYNAIVPRAVIAKKWNILWFVDAQHFIERNIDHHIRRIAKKLFIVYQPESFDDNYNIYDRFRDFATANSCFFINLLQCNATQQLFISSNNFNSRNNFNGLLMTEKFELKINRRKFEPYVYKATGVRQSKIGMEELLLTAIAQKLNTTLIYASLSKQLSKVRNIDIFAGGYSIGRPPIDGLISTAAFDSDSLTWCIRNAGIRPKWQNVFAILKDIEVLYVGFFMFYTLVLVIYIQSQYERWNYDSYTVMLKILQYLVNISPSVRMRKTATRIAMFLPMWGFILLFATVVSFYIVILHRSIGLYQIHTEIELIEENFRLAGDMRTLNMLNDDKRVIFYCFIFL